MNDADLVSILPLPHDDPAPGTLDVVLLSCVQQSCSGHLPRLHLRHDNVDTDHTLVFTDHTLALTGQAEKVASLTDSYL